MVATPSSAPPGPKARFPGEALLAFRRDPLAFLTRTAREHGPVAQFSGGPLPLFLLSDPDAIRDVLVTHPKSFVKGRGLQVAKRLLGDGLLTSEGAFHLRQRRLAQPAFHRERMAGYGATMVQLAAEAREALAPGETDVAAEMMKLTLAIVSQTLFGSKVEGAQAEDVREAMNIAVEVFQLDLMPLLELFDWLPVGPVARFNKAKARLDAAIFKIIEERRRSGEDRGDLLSMLLLAQDTEGDGTGMSDEQLRDECMTLFLAGHETTANALAWTWHLLSQSPAVEARLHAEVDALGGLPSFEGLGKLPYTRQVLAESMRLYPPAWTVGRRALVDYPVGGYTIPANSVVLMSQWVMHRDPRYWPEPERFDPERWTPEAAAARPKFAYFPFGAGPRQCIGEHFAWAEGILLLATLAQRWRFAAVPGHRVVPEPRITLRPKHGLRMQLARR